MVLPIVRKFEFGIKLGERIAVVFNKKVESGLCGIVGNELPDCVVDVVGTALQRVEFALIVNAVVIFSQAQQESSVAAVLKFLDR